MYEAFGRDAEAYITFATPPTRVKETDMLEWDKYAETKSFPVEGNKVKIPMKRYEVKTLEVRF